MFCKQAKSRLLHILLMMLAHGSACTSTPAPSALSHGFYPLSVPKEVPSIFQVQAISDDGRVIALTFDVPGDSSFVLWRPGMGTQTVVPPTGFYDLRGLAISGDGTVVGGSFQSYPDGNRSKVFLWNADAGFRTLDLPLPPMVSQAFMGDLSYDGSVVVGGISVNSVNSGFRWTESGGMIAFGNLGTGGPDFAPASGAGPVSGDGQVVAGTTTTSEWPGRHPATWTEANGWEVPTPIPGSWSGQVNSINYDGSIMVGTTSMDNGGPSIATIYQDGGGVVILPGLDGVANHGTSGLSGDGSLIGGFALESFSGESSYEAIVWKKVNGEYQIEYLESFLQQHGISYDGWQDLTIDWISPDGSRIAGTALDENNRRRPYLAVLSVPEPPAMLLMGCLIAGLFARSRYRSGR
jgi:uncharacterized membrane protein